MNDEQEQPVILKCEACGNHTQDLTNVMIGVPMEIIAVCSVCLAQAEGIAAKENDALEEEAQ